MILSSIVVPEDLKIAIVDFACTTGLSFFKMNVNGSGRRFCPLSKIDHPLQRRVADFANYCYGTLNVTVIEEPKLGNFIGFNSAGGFVHLHTDPSSIPQHDHIRLNVLLSKPIQGGNPVIDGAEVNINEGQCWINVASRWKHASTPVQGNIPRVVLSMGSLVPCSQVDTILNELGIS